MFCVVLTVKGDNKSEDLSEIECARGKNLDFFASSVYMTNSKKFSSRINLVRCSDHVKCFYVPYLVSFDFTTQPGPRGDYLAVSVPTSTDILSTWQKQSSEGYRGNI